jgi:hypothetical protein
MSETHETDEAHQLVRELADAIGLTPGEPISITLDPDEYPGSVAGEFIVTRTDDGSGDATYDIEKDETPLP